MEFLAKSRSAESRRKRLLWSVISAAFIVLLGLTLYAWQQQRTAKRQEQNANMNLAQEAYENKRSSRLYDLLNIFLPSAENRQFAPTREFYWYHLWHAAHHETQTLKGHESYVWSVAFSPDGKTLASASSDQTVKLWDVVTRQTVATLKGHEGGVGSVAFSPDGKTLASGGWDKTVKLWDVATRQNVATLKGHEDSVWSIAFSPDSKTLALAEGDNERKKDFAIRLWFAATDEEVARQRNK